MAAQSWCGSQMLTDGYVGTEAEKTVASSMSCCHWLTLAEPNLSARRPRKYTLQISSIWKYRGGAHERVMWW